MRTPRALYPTKSTVYTCELRVCPICQGRLRIAYTSGPKTVQKMEGVWTLTHQPRVCPKQDCPRFDVHCRSAQWEQSAPRHCTYGYDVIAQIGWLRQTHHQRFEDIHKSLQAHLHVSESEVRYLYHDQYLPLLACHERQNWEQLNRLSAQNGLLLGLDGLCPEGGEPQLWVVRELQTGLTLRSGWLSRQDEATFVNFLQPIADSGLRVLAILSDKQRGLAPAVPVVFPQAKHAFCQAHYLSNVAEPIAEADEAMKVTLRKEIRDDIGLLIRQEKVESPGVLTITGLLPTPVDLPDEAPEPEDAVVADPVEAAREEIVQDILRRVRYLLTLKGRPPFRLAGVEMFERLNEVAAGLDTMINRFPDDRLLVVRQGLRQALLSTQSDYTDLRQAADWLTHISDLLDPENKPQRSGQEVQEALFAYLDEIQEQSRHSPRLSEFHNKIRQTSLRYASGLFHCYDVPGLPRTNNERESEFRELNRRLLSTTGQLGLVKRILHRQGAWELIPRPDSLSGTVSALAQVDPECLAQERKRIRSHRRRFRLHTRSPKQSQAQLNQLVSRWHTLASINSS
jgi:hypothetical protein